MPAAGCLTCSQLTRSWRRQRTLADAQVLNTRLHSQPKVLGARPGTRCTSWSRWRRQQARPALLVREGRRCRRLVVCAARDPYDLLGVPRTAALDEIKRAYRKKALKLHPDVNKAADAKDRFMECKNAYQQLLDEKERGSRGAWPGSGGWGDWGDLGRSYRPGSSSSGGSSTGPRPPPRQEEVYGFGELVDLALGLGQGARQQFEKAVAGVEDLIRDLEKEFSEYGKERKAAKAAGGSSSGSGTGDGKMKGLWEEVADIGEEFVEFLEQELGLSSDDEGKRQAKSSSKAGDAARTQAKEQGQPQQHHQQQQQSNASRGSSADKQGPQQPKVQPPARSRADEVEDELQALKRKMGIK